MLGNLLAANTGGQLGSMFVFFLIALAIVSPFGYRRIRSVLRERREALAMIRGGDDIAPTTTEPTRPPAPADDLSRVVEAIAAARADLVGDASGTRTIDVPAEPLVEGRPSSRVIVDALIGDAVRRSGLRSEWVDDGGVRRLLLRADGP